MRLSSLVRIGLLLIFTSCQSVWWLNPQAAVDSIDIVRKRNERAIFNEALDQIEYRMIQANRSIEIVGSKKPCELQLQVEEPILFATYGVPHAYTIRSPSGILASVYNIGDHKQLKHELIHAIMLQQELTKECMQELVAYTLADDPMFDGFKK